MKGTTRKNIRSKGSYKKLIIICLLSIILLTSCNMATKEGNSNEPIIPTPNGEDIIEPPDEDTEIIDEPVEPDKPVEPEEAEEPHEDTSGANDDSMDKVQQKMSTMTIEEKVAQMFIITPEALTSYKKVMAAGDVTRDALREYPVGGLVYFAQNIVSPDQLKKMTKNTQEYAEETQGMPLFISIDEEGGKVARIANNDNFSVKQYVNMASIGETGDFQKAYEVGQTIGAYLHEYGFNLDFAPNSDVLTNPNNKVIGKRSFGSDPDLVTKMNLELAQGLADNHILSCFKHFPGHGGTLGDSHEGFAYTDKTLDELKKSELIPFKAAVDNDIPFIMISHISVPNVIGDNTPSSLSKVMITDILREEMGYGGIIITDAMNMGAIVNTYGAKDAVIQSIQAGVDIILMPQDFKIAYEGVLYAINQGIITEDRIDESLERIIRVKLNTTK